MKKARLVYIILIATMLTSCGSKTINDDLNSNNVDTTVEVVTNNETIVSQTDPIVVTGLTSDSTQVQLGVGETIQLEYSVLPESADEKYCSLDWSSTDETIVTVDENGLLTGVEDGMCTVVATSRNNPDVVLKFSVTVTGEGIVSQAVQGSTISIPTSKFTTTTTITTTTTTTTTTTETPPPTEEPTETSVQSEETQLEWLIQEETTEVVDVPDNVAPTYVNGILLVNDTHPLPSTYEPTNTWGEYNLESEVQQAFDSMNSDAMTEGISLTIHTGYVPYSQQVALYQDAVGTYGQEYANQHFDVAGYSESQTGLSITLNSGNSQFDGTAEATWVAENCYKYGFIVRYPQGKESSTGKAYRSYQIRYVGVSVATEIYSQNLSLEEYLGQ